MSFGVQNTMFIPYGRIWLELSDPSVSEGNLLYLQLINKYRYYSCIKQQPLWTSLGKKSSENIVGKGKMLVTNIFFFSHNAFYPIEDKYNDFSNNKFVFLLQVLSVMTRLKFCPVIKG